MAVPPAYLPLPSECGSGFGTDDAILTEACAKIMSQRCMLASATNGDSPLLHSAMSDPSSSCGVWYGAVNLDRWTQAATAMQAGTTSSLTNAATPYVDSAIASWCSAFPGAEDCSCVAFPYYAQAFCSGQEACGLAPEFCAATEFVQTSTQTGEVEVVQFNSCSAFPCWLEACRGGGELLITTPLLDQQIFHCPTGLCFQSTEENVTSVSSNRPMPPGSFVVNSTVMECGTPLSSPPLLAAQALNISLPQNSGLSVHTVLSNDGSQPCSWRVSDYGATWLRFVPESQDLCMGHSTSLIQVLFDPTQFVVGGAAQSTTVLVEYESLTQGSKTTTQTLEWPVTFSMLPATQEIIVTKTVTPVAALGGIVVLGLVGLGLLVAVGIDVARRGPRP